MSADPAFRDGVAFVDGAYVPVAEARLPLLDMGFIRSDACQDTISVSQGRFFRLEDHLERFERSCTRLRMTCPHDRAALRDGALPTPEAGVLDGMTRTTVFELAAELDLDARLARLSPDDLRGADEVFVGSTAGGIMPVRQVDDRPIGDGAPGPATERLRMLYWSKRDAGWHGTDIDYS
jgi:branched-subunit amino acid aminotransferase/4-amino-4-deoxychorismate lyase